MKNKEKFLKYRNKAAQCAILLVAVMGISVLIGWIFDIRLLIQVYQALVPMQFNTALLFLLSSISLMALTFRYRLLCSIVAIFVSTFAIVTFVQYLFGINLYLDELFLTAHVTTRSSSPGRMAPITAVSFFLIGISIISLSIKILRVYRWVGASLSAITLAFAFVSMIGYLTNLHEAYGWYTLTDMAIHTSLGFILLGGAVLLLSLNLNSRGQLAYWLIVPSSVFTFMTALLLWRAIDVKRAYTLALGVTFHLNPIIIIIIFLLIVAFFSILYKGYKISNQFEMSIIELENVSVAKSRLLGFISHEIRGPVHTIIGYSELQTLVKDLPPQASKAFSSIHQVAMHMSDLVQDLLATAQIESGKLELHPKRFETALWLSRLERYLKGKTQHKSVELTLCVSEHVPRILYADASKLSQISINLVENAAKFTPPGKKVEMHVAYDRMTDTSGKLIIQVKDQGRGIEQSVVERLFQPFFQAKESDAQAGLGLGLFICEQLIRLMGGTITVESQIGHGSTFTCVIEIVDEGEEIGGL